MIYIIVDSINNSSKHHKNENTIHFKINAMNYFPLRLALLQLAHFALSKSENSLRPDKVEIGRAHV